MADSAGKVTPGSPFRAPPATIWNNMIDAGQAVAAGLLSSGPPSPTRPRATDLLKLKNSSGDVRRKGEILKIEGKAIETVTDEHIWLNGIEPTAECRFGILKSPAGNAEMVTSQVSGVCLAIVNVTDANHTFASAADADYVLQSGASGPLEILFAPEGTGEFECVVRFAGGSGGSLGFVHFVCVDYDVEDGIATCLVMDKACGSSVPDMDDLEQIEVIDPAGCYFSGEDDESLPGRHGFAIHMDSLNPPEGSYNNCFWACCGLCCQDILE